MRKRWVWLVRKKIYRNNSDNNTRNINDKGNKIGITINAFKTSSMMASQYSKSNQKIFWPLGLVRTRQCRAKGKVKGRMCVKTFTTSCSEFPRRAVSGFYNNYLHLVHEHSLRTLMMFVFWMNEWTNAENKWYCILKSFKIKQQKRLFFFRWQ